MSEKVDREPINLIDQLEISGPFARMLVLMREMGLKVAAIANDAELQFALTWRIEEAGVPSVEMINRKFNELGHLMAPLLVQMLQETSVDIAVPTSNRGLPRTPEKFLATKVDEVALDMILDRHPPDSWGNPEGSTNPDL